MTAAEAKAYLDDPKVGDQIIDQLPPMDFGRIAAQSAKQVILQKVREAERERQYEEFKDRQGEIINGLVKRTEYGNVIVDVGRGEAVLRRDQLINREIPRRNSSPVCSKWKCRRFMTASSRSRPLPAIRVRAPRSA
jgi:N utilization substance protein A